MTCPLPCRWALTVGSFALVHSAAGQTGGTPSARGITVGTFALVINVIYSIILLFMGLETSFVVAIFGHALPSSILTGLVAIPFLMSGRSPAMDSPHVADARRVCALSPRPASSNRGGP